VVHAECTTRSGRYSDSWAPRLPTSPTSPLPRPKPIKIDNRRKEILRHTAAQDLSGIPALIPYVGDIVADVIEDLHGKEIMKLLTPGEKEEYTKFDKTAPSTIAAIRTFLRVKPD